LRSNLFDRDLQFIENCAKILNLDSEIRTFLKWPMRELHISIPIQMDDESVKVFKGFRVQHNDALGPIIGGIRFISDTDFDLLSASAALMTWKTSLLGLPLGGGMGGVICNPEELSEGELERLSRGYMRRIWQWVERLWLHYW
jgi:glutamate dehydrogenase (NAD(P)+)